MRAVSKISERRPNYKKFKSVYAECELKNQEAKGKTGAHPVLVDLSRNALGINSEVWCDKGCGRGCSKAVITQILNNTSGDIYLNGAIMIKPIIPGKKPD